MAQDPTYPFMPIANFTGFVLVLIPFSISALQKWNTGICMFAIYVSIMCLFTAIDTIVWSDNYDVIASVWCDIVSHFIVASNIGIPACSLVISRRLCKIIKRRSLTTESTKNSKRKELIFDLCITAGLPILGAGIYYIIQGVRFQVIGGLGCTAALIDSGLTIILEIAWPILFPAISILFYSPQIIWFYYRQRREVNEFLDSNQTINRGDYFRVMMLGCLDAALMLPIGIFHLVIDILGRTIPFWPGWTPIHSDWEAEGAPESAWSANRLQNLEMRYTEVVNPILAVVFFLIFGITAQARSSYWRMIYSALKSLGIKINAREKAGIVSTIRFGSEARENSGATTSGSTHTGASDLSGKEKKSTGKPLSCIKPEDGKAHMQVDTHTSSAKLEC